MPKDKHDLTKYWFACWQFTNEANGLLVTEAQIYYDEDLVATKIWSGVHAVDALLLARTWFLRYSGKTDPPHTLQREDPPDDGDVQMELPF